MMWQMLTLSLCFIVAVVNCSTQRKQVVEGTTVSFTCTLSDELPYGDIDWVIQWFNNQVLITDATKVQTLENTKLTGRGVYTTRYRSTTRGSGQIIHECTLRVEHVTSKDNGTFKCVHDGWFKDRGTFYTGLLRVTKRIAGSPDCLARPVENDAELLVGVSVELNCSLQNGDSKAILSWYRNGHEFLESANATTFAMNHTLKNVDNGVDFVCTVTSTSNTDKTEERQCHVAPFKRSPNVTTLTFYLHPSNGLFVIGSFMCCGTGIPRIDRYKWYVNESLVTENETRYQIHVSKAHNCSALLIYDITTDDNITQVQCEVIVPAGLSSSATATIILPDDLNHRFTTISSKIPGKTIQQTPSMRYTNGEDQSYTANVPQMTTKSFSNVAQQTKCAISIGVGVASVFVNIIIIIVVILLVRRQRPNYNRSTDPIVIQMTTR